MRNQTGFEPTTLISWATRSAIWATVIRYNFIYFFSGGLDDGGESGLLGDFSPSSPLHLAKTTTALTATSFSQSPSSPPFCGMPHQPTTTTTPTTTAARATPGRLEFSPEKAGMDVTPLNLDFLDRSQLPPQPLALASLTGKLNIFWISNDVSQIWTAPAPFITPKVQVL